MNHWVDNSSNIMFISLSGYIRTTSLHQACQDRLGKCRYACRLELCACTWLQQSWLWSVEYGIAMVTGSLSLIVIWVRYFSVCDDHDWHNLYPGTYTIINERGEFIDIMQISEIKHIFNIFMTWLIAYQVLCLITPIHYHSCTIMNVGWKKFCFIIVRWGRKVIAMQLNYSHTC